MSLIYAFFLQTFFRCKKKLCAIRFNLQLGPYSINPYIEVFRYYLVHYDDNCY